MKREKVFCDVLVVGAGVSGVAAAVSAARKGAKTIIIEKNSLPGGSAVIAMHRYICGLRLNGLAKEVSSVLAKLDKKSKMISMGKVRVLPFQTNNLKIVLNRLIKAEKKINIFYDTKAISVKKKQDIIIALGARCANKILDIYPKTIIDASADGVVIGLSAAKYKIAPIKERQLQGFSICLKDIKSKDQLLELKIPYFIRNAIEAKALPEYFKFTVFFPGSLKGEGICRFSIPYIRGFNINKNAELVHDYLRKRLPELKDSYIAAISSEVSPREGVRLLGEYILTKKDVLGARKFKDSIARGIWPIEFWDQKYGQQLEYLPAGKYYGIPKRCLHSINVRNLFATGRCISATSQALASTRVMGACMALGEAAGKAAEEYARTFS